MKAERRRLIISLCVSAYPDLQPWQVKKACLEKSSQSVVGAETRKHCTDECLTELYYTYLSQLLNPLEGHEAARHDGNLVKVGVS